jgi:cytochrome c556
MRFATIFSAIFVIGALAGRVLAQENELAEIIKSRQDQMKALGADFAIINSALKADAPDAAIIAEASKRIAEVIKDTKALYPVGTGPASGLKTRAKAEIWSQNGEFNRADDESIAEAQRFLQTAAAGDVNAVKAGFKALTDSCVACHVKFRAEEKK